MGTATRQALRWRWPRRVDRARIRSRPRPGKGPDPDAASSDSEQHVIPACGLDRARVFSLQRFDRLSGELLTAVGVDSFHAGRAVPPAGEHRDHLLGRFPPYRLFDHLDAGRRKARIERCLRELARISDRISGGGMITGAEGGPEPTIVHT